MLGCTTYLGRLAESMALTDFQSDMEKGGRASSALVVFAELFQHPMDLKSISQAVFDALHLILGRNVTIVTIVSRFSLVLKEP